MRDLLDQYRNPVAIGALAVIGFALIVLARGLFGHPIGGSDRAFYYDSVTGEIFTASGSLFPPIDSPDGNPAYRVYLYACGDCRDRDQRFPLYFMKYDAQAKQALEAAQALPDDQLPDEQVASLERLIETGQRYSFDGTTWSKDADLTRLSHKVSQLVAETCENGEPAIDCARR